MQLPPTSGRSASPDALPCCDSCPHAQGCQGAGLVRHAHPAAGPQPQRGVRLRKGQPLYLIGDPVTALYAIRVGTLKTHVTTEDGRTQVVGFHFPGELVGLDSLVRTRYASYATALEDTKLCMIAVDLGSAAMAAAPALAIQLFLALDCMTQRARAMQTMLALMTAEERLVTFLLWMADGFAARGFSSSAFILRMSREEIGSYVGLTLETVSRQFSRMAGIGLIRVRNRCVELLDKPALRAIAERPKISARTAPDTVAGSAGTAIGTTAFIQ
ncbi:helix-turn-helix domain-containing protein [Cupriavidus sp. IK-TO18]|uniref:Cyclic nucleotide-binding domain-containing protein n=1 Tax=Cupriavidus oxalaticus TaxID=96344 RepID=A0A4P7L3Y0_9BURK|nr:helix-turn-helix domain-containing protein [Cupriavidus sp. IK-TO18]MBF6987879.1 helix-turn-helix domain-containing protein [Cupriavidus sp. IK-TO18]QBY49980.1 cyclic nucleotide-binding domain-containing protein [Cupriavidus oxalaticus]TDF65540.1 cyclic nucleotide-binding domain-containing protein [Cupriavidus sp. L7L]